MIKEPFDFTRFKPMTEQKGEFNPDDPAPLLSGTKAKKGEKQPAVSHFGDGITF